MRNIKYGVTSLIDKTEVPLDFLYKVVNVLTHHFRIQLIVHTPVKLQGDLYKRHIFSKTINTIVRIY